VCSCTAEQVTSYLLQEAQGHLIQGWIKNRAVAPWGKEGEYVVFAKLLCGWQNLKSYAHSLFLERFYLSCYMKIVSSVQSFESFSTRA
jgi:hypothetical protein